MNLNPNINERGGLGGMLQVIIPRLGTACSAAAGAAAAAASQTWKMAAAGQNTTKTIGGN